METGVSYNKQRLHKVGYFRELLSTNEDVHASIRPLLRLSRRFTTRSSVARVEMIPSKNMITLYSG
jgi:transposase